LRIGSKQEKEDLLSIAKLGKGKKSQRKIFFPLQNLRKEKKTKGRSSFHCKTWERKKKPKEDLLSIAKLAKTKEL
jgi:hypothetical protein